MNDLRELVFMALGEASVCWKDRKGLTEAGVFDTVQATEIAEKLIEDILYALETPVTHD